VKQALDGMPEGPIKADAPGIVLPDREKMKELCSASHREDSTGRSPLPGLARVFENLPSSRGCSRGLPFSGRGWTPIPA